MVFCITNCSEKSGEPTAKEDQITVPPLEYQVGIINTDNEYVDKYMEMNISVSPKSTESEIEELLTYFERQKYQNYDMLKIRVYDSPEYAERTSVDKNHLLAELTLTRPNHRELQFYQLSPKGEDKYEVLINETVEDYLGEKSNLFDSGKQAQYLLKMMEETPNRTIYRLSWLQPHKVVLTYSVKQEMLIRKHEGISEETWLGMTEERLERAAKGAGFGGPKTPGITYELTPYRGEMEEDIE